MRKFKEMGIILIFVNKTDKDVDVLFDPPTKINQSLPNNC